MSEFTEQERAHIEATFTPGSLTRGHVTYTSEKPHHLLRALAGWFRQTDSDADIARRIMLKHDQIKPRRGKPRSNEATKGREQS